MSKLEEAYIFWLYDYTIPFYKNLFQPFGGTAMCVVDDSQLVTYEHSPSVLAIRDITTVSSYLTGGSRHSEYAVEVSQRNGKGLALYPRNPLDPANRLKARSEADALVEVIEALRQGIKPRLEVNPYRRELAQRGNKSEITQHAWDARTSPWVFYRLHQSPVQVRRVLLWILGTFLAIVVCLVLLIWLTGMRS